MTRIFCFVFLLCSTHIFSQSDYSLAIINKELKENSNSILIDELVEIDVSDINKMKTKTHRVLAVLNKMGDGDANLFEFYDTNSRLKNVEVWIYNVFGQEVNHFKKKNFLDVSRTGNNMYVDSRVLYLNYTPTTYPYIVVFESEMETGDSAYISPWYPLGDYAESTQKSVLKIKFDPENKPKYKAENLEGYDIKISETPEEIIFTANNLKAIRYEEHSASRNTIFPNVTVALNKFKLKGTLGSGKDWQEFGSWMNESLLNDVDQLPEGTVARAKSLVANDTTNEAKARKIYQFVQDKVRYISIQIGIGGWKPMLATDVDKLSYGDCKALTNYTKSLLDVVGVPSYYTVLYAGDSERDIMSDFTSLQGNHVILGIPDGDEITWLECTSQETPYGYLGDFSDDRDVLIMTPEGGKIARTKIYTTEESAQNNTVKIKVDANGNVSADFESISQGLQYDNKYMLPRQKNQDVDEYYKNRWSYINGFSLNSFDFTNDRDNIIFTEKTSVTIPNYANSVGKDFLFGANVFNQSQYIPPRIENRKQNLYLDYGYVDIDSVEVEIPENFSIESLPEPTILETKFGKYEIAFSRISENKMSYTRKLRMDKGEYPPEEYENYRDFLRAIARLDRTKVLLKQTVE